MHLTSQTARRRPQCRPRTQAPASASCCWPSCWCRGRSLPPAPQGQR